MREAVGTLEQNDQMFLMKIRPRSSKFRLNLFTSNWMGTGWGLLSAGWICIENFKLLCTMHIGFNQCQKN
jgi:hypothetical protein